MSICIKWGNMTVKKCVAWADQGSNQCSAWADQGTNVCTSWADHGSNQCSSWSNWFSWLCLAFFWVAKWVCVASMWVADLVCTAVVWVAALVCIATTVIVTVVCWLWLDVALPLLAGTAFALAAPFGAAIDALCRTCNSYEWLKRHLLRRRIDFISREDDPANPGKFIYKFSCRCRGKLGADIQVVAADDYEAAKLAKDACADVCA